MKGYIPDTINIYELSENRIIDGNIARPAFVTDHKNKYTNITRQYYINYLSKLRPEISCKKISGIKNTAKKARFLGVSFRGNNKFNLLFDDKWIVEIHSDILSDIILNDGIAVGGMLPGEYIFAYINSFLQPIRVGSAAYKTFLKKKSFQKIKKIKIKDLVVGKIYKEKNNKIVAYLGSYYCLIPEIEKKGFGFYSHLRNLKLCKKHYFFSPDYYNENNVDIFLLKKSWDNINNILNKADVSDWRAGRAGRTGCLGEFRSISSHNCIIDTGKSIDIDNFLDFISPFREEIKESIGNMIGRNKKNSSLSYVDDLQERSSCCFIYKTKKEALEAMEDIRKFFVVTE